MASALTAALVATGMNAGVLTLPLVVVITPALAFPDASIFSMVKCMFHDSLSALSQQHETTILAPPCQYQFLRAVYPKNRIEIFWFSLLKKNVSW